MTPDEQFISDLSIIAHTYILDCRKKSCSISDNIAPLIVTILEAEIESIKGDLECLD
jgi:hypothetical protein